MIKIFTLCFTALLLTFTVQAQRNCGTMHHDAMLRANDPQYAANREKIEAYTQRYIQKKQADGTRSSSVITIPVVIHIVWKEDIENISDAQARSQIDVLNEDFRKLNDNAGDIPAEFAGVAADMEIEFCLATIDPDGNSTSGIERIETDVDSWIDDDAVKFSSEGGADAWPADDYLNLWCCRLTDGLLGYAQFPGGADATDGVCITFSSFGRTGYVIAPYDLGRTASHEVGHWLNLIHIWGDDGDCSGSDLCGDTPNQKVATYGCPPYPASDDCSDSYQFQNYMDYTDDACYMMFTNDQKTRAKALFEPGGQRYSLASSTKCFSFDHDAECVEVVSPTGTYCYDTFNPVVTIKNAGLEEMTSVDINFAVDVAPPSTFFWTGSLGSGDQVDVNLPSLSLPEGSHTLTVTLGDPNGIPDEFLDNNTAISSFTVNVSGFDLPLIQGFEDGGFPYGGYTVTNPDGLWAWEQTSLAGRSSAYSVYINTFLITDIGEFDELQLPAYNLEGLTSAHLDFDLANAAYSYDPDWSDTLEVLISSDCGENWTSIYKKFKPDLATTTPTGANFVPTNDQWRTESISLTPYLAEQLIVKFKSTSNWENNTFLDNININAGSVDVVDYNALNFSLYPVPANDFLNVQYYVAGSDPVHAEIYNALGQTVMQADLKGYAGNNTTTLGVQQLIPGYYTIKIFSGGNFAVNTFVKQ